MRSLFSVFVGFLIGGEDRKRKKEADMVDEE